MRAFLSSNEINNSIRDDDGREEGTNRNTGKRRHPAYYAMYNAALLVKENMVTFPEIASVSELRGIVRSVYWLNNRNTIAINEGELDGNMVDHDNTVGNETNEMISLGFEAMKSCNLLSSNELDSRRSKRELSIRVRRDANSSSDTGEEFPDVTYHVGQVVQHKIKKWRGVIVGWTIQSNKVDAGRLSSLTTKQYSLEADIPSSDSENNLGDKSVTKSPVQYTVLVDSNDANLLRCSSTISLESEVDLTAVDDPL